MKPLATGPLLAGLLLSWPARGAESAPTRVSLNVHAACTDEADFWHRVNARTLRVVAGEGEGALSVALAIESSGARATGTIRIRSSGEPGESVRRVEGASCEDVADALSLVVALTFDPDTLAVLPAPQPEARPDPEPAKPNRPTTTTTTPEPSPPPDRWRMLAGARGALAAIDELPLGAGLVVEGARGAGLHSRAFRLGLSMLETTVTLDERSARFRWLLGAAEVCPLRLSTRTDVDLSVRRSSGGNPLELTPPPQTERPHVPSPVAFAAGRRARPTRARAPRRPRARRSAGRRRHPQRLCIQRPPRLPHPRHRPDDEPRSRRRDALTAGSRSDAGVPSPCAQ
jgi:hypothetical protein